VQSPSDIGHGTWREFKPEEKPIVKSFLWMETFEKCSILLKFKEGENSNPPDFHRDSQEYP
jgi:hypothetical protein